MNSGTRFDLKTLPEIIGPSGLLTDGDWVESVDQDPGGSIQLTQLADVGDGEFRFRSHRWMNEEQARRLAVTYLQPGDVLVARMPDPLGRACVCPVLMKPAVTVVDVCIIRAPGHNPRWLMHAINAPQTRSRMAALEAGTTRKRISKKNLSTIPIPIPSLSEQSRVVNAIEVQVTRLAAAMASLERVKSNLKRARASVLKAAVEGRLVPTEAALARSEGRDYEPASALLSRILSDRRARWAESDGKGKYNEPVTADLDQVGQLPVGWVWCSCDQAGEILLGRRRAPEYTGAAQLYLRVANVKDGHLQLDDVQRMPFEDAEFEKYRLQPGDILVSEGQSPELVGQSALYSGTPNPCAFQATLHRFRSDGASVLPRYAETVFRAWVRGGVFRRRCIVTTNIGHLTLGRFKSVSFPLPPLAEQRRIVTEVDRRLSVLDAIELTVNADLARCASLRQSILKRAFEGRLVPPEPATIGKPLSPLSSEDAVR